MLFDSIGLLIGHFYVFDSSGGLVSVALGVLRGTSNAIEIIRTKFNNYSGDNLLFNSNIILEGSIAIT